MTKTNKYLAALAVVLIVALLFIFALMLYPLYHSTFTHEYDVEIPFYLTIDGKEVEYTKTETLSRDSFIIPFIKEEKLEVEDRYGIWNVYSWKIAPGENSEYLIFELNDERIAFLEEHRINGEVNWRVTSTFIGKRVSAE